MPYSIELPIQSDLTSKPWFHHPSYAQYLPILFISFLRMPTNPLVTVLYFLVCNSRTLLAFVLYGFGIPPPFKSSPGFPYISPLFNLSDVEFSTIFKEMPSVDITKSL